MNAVSQPTLIISLDFELFWGMQDVVSLEAYKDNILGVRKAIPMMLEMFRNKGIHATWAAVGYYSAIIPRIRQNIFLSSDPATKTKNYQHTLALTI